MSERTDRIPTARFAFVAGALALMIVAFIPRPAAGQAANQILTVSPDSAEAGTSGLTVTLTLDTDTPPAPPENVQAASVRIANVAATSASRPDRYTISAVFDIPAGETSGAKDVEVTFPTPNGQLTFSRASGFTVTGGGGGPPEVPDLAYRIVDTGQDACFNTRSETAPPASGQPFAGQDAQTAGHQPEYVVSDDGLTVYDAVTGLTWLRSPDTDGDGDIDSGDKLTWTELQAYSGALNDATFGGFDDWRTPTIKELYSLIDFRGTDPNAESDDPTGLTPFIDAEAFEFAYGDIPAGERIIDSQYWTNTAYVSTTMNGSATVFGVNFADGRIKGYPRDTGAGGRPHTRFALCVRGNADYGINAFVDNGDGTITDRATGLMWQLADSGEGFDWEGALAYAEDLDLADHRDWRLPNAKELQSILDYTRSPDTTASAAIDPVFDATAITNERDEVDYPSYWTGTTHIRHGGVGANAVYVAFGRAMGYMNRNWLDVHGAGAQRSDPKAGDPADFPTGRGPQGDAIRIYNHVRCVRDASIDPETTFRRGDANDDGGFDISDCVYTLSFLFSEDSSITCLDSADVNDSGRVDISDAIYSLGFLFQGGPAPQGPFGECGTDPTADDLTCDASSGCSGQ